MHSAGRISDSVYDRSVAKIMNKKPSAGGHTVLPGRVCGIACEGDFQMITACASRCSKAADLGSRMVYLAVNRLMAAGARPVSISVQILMPLEEEEACLRQTVKSVQKAVAGLGLEAAQRDVLAAEGLKAPFVSVTAAGKAFSLFRPEDALSDQDLIMTGFAGWSGSVSLAESHADQLKAHFNTAFLAPVRSGSYLTADAVCAAADAGVRAMTAAGEGGVFGAVWEMAERSGLGVKISLKDILLRQETVEICDFLNISPYMLGTEGVLLMAVTHGQKVLSDLAAAGIPAAIIGHFTDDNDRVVINEDEVRYLEPYRGDSILL